MLWVLSLHTKRVRLCLATFSQGQCTLQGMIGPSPHGTQTFHILHASDVVPPQCIDYGTSAINLKVVAGPAADSKAVLLLVVCRVVLLSVWSAACFSRQSMSQGEFLPERFYLAC